MGDDVRTFTCAACGGTFNCGWSEEEAEAEYRALFPDSAASAAAREEVCDDCHKQMIAAQPPTMFEAMERMERARDKMFAGMDLTERASYTAFFDLVSRIMIDGSSDREPVGILSVPEAIEPPRVILSDRPRKFDRRGVIPSHALHRRLH